MKKWLGKIQEKIQALKNPRYTACLIDEQRGIVRDSVFEVVGEQQYLGHGKYGIVKSLNINLLNNKQNRKKNMIFATKEFRKNSDKIYALKMFNEVKKTGVYTWNTYRNIIGTNSVLMTLGNNKDTLLFSSNNNSVDASKVLGNPIDNITNEEEFYHQCYDTVEKLTKGKLKVPDDSYLFEYKNGNLKILTGDFDGKKKLKQEELKYLLEENLKYILFMLLNGKKYFTKNIDLFHGFIIFLKKKNYDGERIDEIEKEVQKEFDKYINIKKQK